MQDPNRPAASVVWWAGWLLSAVLLTAVVGCSPEQSTHDPVAAQAPTVDSQAAEQALRERVQVYWQAKRIHDEVTVYRMEAKSLSKESYTPQVHYRSRANKLRILGFSINDIQIDDDKAMVSLEVAHGLVFFGKTQPVKKQISDSWTLIDGQWYHGRSGRHKGQGQTQDPPVVGDYRDS